MDQVTVPQFIDNEDKILGPLTVRQFVVLFIGAVTLFIIYKVADFTFFLFMCIVIGGLVGIIGFFKINGRPFHFFALGIVQTMQRPSLRVWKKEVSMLTLHWGSKKTHTEEGTHPTAAPHLQLSNQKLSELSLIVDTGGAYRGERDEEGNNM